MSDDSVLSMRNKPASTLRSGDDSTSAPTSQSGKTFEEVKADLRRQAQGDSVGVGEDVTLPGSSDDPMDLMTGTTTTASDAAVSAQPAVLSAADLKTKLFTLLRADALNDSDPFQFSVTSAQPYDNFLSPRGQLLQPAKKGLAVSLDMPSSIWLPDDEGVSTLYQLGEDAKGAISRAANTTFGISTTASTALEGIADTLVAEPHHDAVEWAEWHTRLEQSKDAFASAMGSRLPMAVYQEMRLQHEIQRAAHAELEAITAGKAPKLQSEAELTHRAMARLDEATKQSMQVISGRDRMYSAGNLDSEAYARTGEIRSKGYSTAGLGVGRPTEGVEKGYLGRPQSLWRGDVSVGFRDDWVKPSTEDADEQEEVEEEDTASTGRDDGASETSLSEADPPVLSLPDYTQSTVGSISIAA